MSTPAAPALHVVEHGGDGPTVVLLHGFTQTQVSWAPIADRLDADLHVLRVDLPGHGGSGTIAADLHETSDLLAHAVADLGVEQAIWVGYSMGARQALRVALDHPGLAAGLVLVSGTAGIDGAAARAERRSSDALLADRIEDGGVVAFLDAWLAMPLFASLATEPADLAARQANTASGLATSLRLAGTGTMDPPWWEELDGVTCPTTVVWGSLDEKFSVLGQRLVDGLGGRATGVAVPGAGHAAQLEQPAAVAQVIDSHARSLRG